MQHNGLVTYGNYHLPPDYKHHFDVVYFERGYVLTGENTAHA